MIEALLTLVEGNGTIIAQDATIYGTPLRSEVVVDFQVFRKVDEVETPIVVSYDPSTVNTIEFPVSDGWYKVVMTITNTLDNSQESTATEQYIVTTALDACVRGKLIDFACVCCDDLAFMDYAKVQAAREAISELVLLGLYQKAYCVLEGISTCCKDDCNDC